MRTSYFPSTDGGLLAWGLNLSTRINASPGSFGISVEQSANFASLQSAYASALAEAADLGTRSRVKVSTKNAAREALKAAARLLVSIIHGQESVTDAQKIELGLTVRSKATPQPAPVDAPVIDVVTVSGNTVSIRLHDSVVASRRGKPPSVDGASLFSFIGEGPADPSLFKFERNIARTTADVVFPASVQPGTRVWVAAYWFNNRKQRGPMSNPVSTNLQFGGMIARAGLSLAA